MNAFANLFLFFHLKTSKVPDIMIDHQSLKFIPFTKM